MLLSVFHDFFCQFGKTKIFVTKKPEGYGLVCHRAIKTACEVIGIKDLYAKVEGSTNLQHIIKAFLIGLLQQVIVIMMVIICYSATLKRMNKLIRFHNCKYHIYSNARLFSLNLVRKYMRLSSVRM
jgi:Ribosomal protein S5